MTDEAGIMATGAMRSAWFVIAAAQAPLTLNGATKPRLSHFNFQAKGGGA